ncbi:(2Fe-2S)-binding protein [Allosphingosinicella indica]|uniref:Sarcosine oxidase subunit alpha n=1 Tax=Allosphingosinicella indica TaxID=941907 RepID=A0A1X7G0L1_9SPHN|nr:(2Fe-2S)-binding protein [Allosphingosinicella indica]SMF61905.1 sarcosine oxidase subunit alpha [Allosphingosinicella indica]
MSGARIEKGVQRGAEVTLTIDGVAMTAFEGETIAAAMLAAGRDRFRDDGGPRGMFCNMGTCGECMVTLAPDGRRVRACVTAVQGGMQVVTDG